MGGRLFDLTKNIRWWFENVSRCGTFRKRRKWNHPLLWRESEEEEFRFVALMAIKGNLNHWRYRRE